VLSVGSSNERGKLNGVYCWHLRMWILMTLSYGTGMMSVLYRVLR